MATPGFDEAFYGRSQHRGAWNAITVKGSIVRSRRRYVDAHAPDALVSLTARSLVQPTCVHDGAPACQWLTLPRA